MNRIVTGDTPRVVFLLTDAADNETNETGIPGSVTAEISKDGGSFAAVTNSVAEIGNGWYYVDLTATETGTEGPLIIRAIVAGTTNEWRDTYLVVKSYVDDLMADANWADFANAIADHVWRRSNANIEAASGPDTLSMQSPYGSIAQDTNKVSASGPTLTVTKADKTTSLGTRTIGTNPSADPISSLETA